MQDLISHVVMAGVSLTRLMYYYSNGNKACAQGKIIFTGTGKATGGASGWGTWFAQHLLVGIFARGRWYCQDVAVLDSLHMQIVWKGHWRCLRLGT